MESMDPSIPKSPSKPTGAVFTKGQRPKWRICDKSKLKRKKSLISAFPTTSRSSASNSSDPDLMRNFDRIPARQGSPPSPGYAYKPEKAVRKKDDRARLPGWDCDMCRDYYEAIASQLTDEELQKLKDKCSRHRYKYAPNLNSTPPGYWDVDFPTTQECIEKGYMGIGVRTPPATSKNVDKPKHKHIRRLPL